MNLKTKFLFATSALVLVSLLAPPTHAAAMQPDEGGAAAGIKPMAGPGAILPDIPQIPWHELRQGKLIGKGGFGDVFEGQWRGQEVAIKVLHMHDLPSGTIENDFDSE